MIELFAIARNTFTQTIRQPVYCILILLTMLVLVATVPLAGLTGGEAGGDFQHTDQRALEGMGLGTLLVSGLFLSIFCAAGTVSREIDDKTALTTISKPVHRHQFVLGKFCGVAAAVTLAFYITSLVLLMTIRHQVRSFGGDPLDWPVIALGLIALGVTLLVALAGNYFFGWPFTAAAVGGATIFFTIAMGLIAFIGRDWHTVPFGQDLRMEVLLAAVLQLMAVLVFVALAVAVSTRANLITSLLACPALIALGSIHPAFEVWAGKYVVAKLLAWVIPNLNLFYMGEAISRPYQPATIPASYMLVAAGYAAIYIIVALAAGVAMFQNRELDAQDGGGSGMPRTVSAMAWLGRISAILLALLGLEGTLAFVLRLISPGLAAGAVTPGLAAGAVTPGLAAGAVTPGWTAGALPLSILLWMLWGYFGCGLAWSHRVVAAITALCLLGSLAALALKWLNLAKLLPDNARGANIALAAVAAVALLVLLLPGTRRHFSNS